MPLPKKKHSLSKITVPPDSKVAKTVQVAKQKPWTALGIVAAIPVIILLAFTFKSNWVPFKHNKTSPAKILITQTPTEIADEATTALQKKDTQTFLDILSNKVTDVNIVNTKGDPLLVAAATMGNYTAVEELILLGVDVNKSNAFTKDTALLRSIYNGHTEIAKRLVYSGADINAVNNYHHSPLFVALEKQNVALIELFLTSGVKEGLTPAYLFRSVANKNEMGVLAMLKGGVSPNIVNEKGNTPLIVSASLGDLPSLQDLLAYRANVNAANKDGNTALIYAARYNHPDVIKMLLTPQTMQVPLDVNAQNKAGETALYWGAAKGHVEVVKRLLAAGADPTIAANNGLVPYAVAQKNGRGQVLEWLNKDLLEVENAIIEQDNAQILAKQKEEEKAQKEEDDIFEATAKGNQIRVKELLRNRTLLSSKDKQGRTPLLVAVENDQKQLVDYFVSEGAKLFDVSSGGNVLHIAVAKNNKAMLEQLVQKARQNGQLSLMLEYKISPAKNVPALTPLGWAARNCNKEIYNYLVSVGAKEGLANQAYSPAALLAQCNKTNTQQAPSAQTTSKTATSNSSKSSKRSGK
ncbi:MAG: ankyrin repeat domain-containing protein [Elusimicrobiaceae bacterium]|nr:ankyrin repeat domain-containing protein [Elusimicrobiaceae bacterium]